MKGSTLLVLLLLLVSSLQCFPVKKQEDRGQFEIHSEDSSPVFQGDIKLTEEQKRAIETLLAKEHSSENGGNHPRARVRHSVLSDMQWLWPDGVVHYEIDDTAKDEKTLSAIMAGIEEYHKLTCVRFVKRTNQEDYIRFTKGSRCSSNVGQIGGAQDVSIGPFCEVKGVVMHELFHVLGRWHEQNRPDRDQYVKIIRENVVEEFFAINFVKLDSRFVTSQGIEYDYHSIMHYAHNAFSKNGKSTIVPLDSDISVNNLGQRSHFTEKDLEHIRSLYCNKVPSPKWSSWGSWSPCSVSCDGGNQVRTRSCQSSDQCVGPSLEKKNCSLVTCPTSAPSPKWGSWGSWSPCSVSCDGGNQVRTRSCQNSDQCVGPSLQRKNCYLLNCPTSAPSPKWGSWGSWSPCSVSCDAGYQVRTRSCQNSDQCVGRSSQRRSCYLMNCPTSAPSPKWGSWGSWSPCSVSCDGGKQVRTRSCQNSDQCVGRSFQRKNCILRNCPTSAPSPKWDSWGSWSPCSVSCDSGNQVRTRSCQNSDQCVGRSSQRRSCYLMNCPTTAPSPKWGSWTSWSPCSVSCDEGYQMRTRSCQNSEECTGRSSQRRSCYLRNCQISAPSSRWGSWGSWSPCNVSCDGGYKVRRRTCQNSEQCVGQSFEKKRCNIENCPTPGLNQLGCYIVPHLRHPLRLLGKTNLNDQIARTQAIITCKTAAQAEGHTMFSVAVGYCISGSDDLDPYCSAGRSLYCGKDGVGNFIGGYVLMDVYRILDQQRSNGKTSKQK